MALILVLQVVFLAVTFVLTLGCVLLPLRLVPRDPSRVSSPLAQRLIAFANCVSGGVFLGTCYAQLIPFIDRKFAEVFTKAGWDVNLVSTVTQCVVCLGFFMILTIEQSVRVCQEGRKNKAVVVQTELAVRVELSDNGTGSDDSDVETTDPKRHMLQRTRPKGHNKAHSHNGGNSAIAVPSNHSHNPASGCSHGHSHITDIAASDFGLRCLLLLAALSTHSLFEGLAVGLQDDLPSLINLFVGVIVHECLMSFAMGVTLAQQNLRLATVIKLCVIYSLTIPVGMAIGMGIGGIHSFAGNFASAIIQALTAGTFVYVIFLEILPSEINSDSDRLLKVMFMFLGFILILCLRFALDVHHHH
jgi:zinc transporter 1/2/3